MKKIFSLLFLLYITGLYAQNATMVANINPGSSNSTPKYLTVFNNKLYFNANDGTNGKELWVYDGTNPPAMVADINLSGDADPKSISTQRSMTVFNNKLYFSADDGTNGRELWVYDGTNPPVMVADIFPGVDGSSPSDMAVFNNKLYFDANNGTDGEELWAYDGTNAPVMVANINTGSNSSTPSNLTVYNNKLYFGANNASYNTELWVYDGTNPPSMVYDIAPTVYAYSNPTFLTVFNNKLYFNADNSVNGQELMYYDGTNNPDTVADIRTGMDGSSPATLVVFNNKLFFSADNGSNGRELWYYDGVNTPAMIEINTGGASNNSWMTVYGTYLFFNATNGTSGGELFAFDGTNTPSLMAEIKPGTSGSGPDYLTVFNGKLYFGADDGTNGKELWEYVIATEAESVIKNENKIGVYPNPAQNTLQLNGIFDGDIEVLNLSGICIYKTQCTKNTTSIDVSGLTAGFYFVRINSGGKFFVSRFIKN